MSTKPTSRQANCRNSAVRPTRALYRTPPPPPGLNEAQERCWLALRDLEISLKRPPAAGTVAAVLGLSGDKANKMLHKLIAKGWAVRTVPPETPWRGRYSALDPREGGRR